MSPKQHALAVALSQVVVLLSSSTLHAQGPVTVEALPEHLLYTYTKKDTKRAATLRGGLASDQVTLDPKRRWENGRTLRVCLFSGNQAVATLVAQVAGEWNKHSGVKLDFGQDKGWYNCLSPSSGHFQVRIGFSERGYWSYMGNDSESLSDALAPSMNLEHFNRLYSESKFPSGDVVAGAEPYHKTVILHEFGHALGLVHEMQNPAMRCQDEIKWEGKDNVYDYFKGSPNFWEADKVKLNLGFIDEGRVVAGKPDRHSVMLYPLPAAVFIKGAESHCFTEVNYELSPLDKEFVATLYPASGAATPAGELDIADANIKALPKFASAPSREDTLSRVKVDLEATDAFIRRDARARLADLMQTAPSGDIDALVSGMQQASYRYKLGVAVALANQRNKLVLNAGTRQRLIQETTAAKDPTLKKNLRAATRQ